jgi:hypothetical protein
VFDQFFFVDLLLHLFKLFFPIKKTPPPEGEGATTGFTGVEKIENDSPQLQSRIILVR